MQLFWLEEPAVKNKKPKSLKIDRALWAASVGKHVSFISRRFFYFLKPFDKTRKSNRSMNQMTSVVINAIFVKFRGRLNFGVKNNNKTSSMRLWNSIAGWMLLTDVHDEIKNFKFGMRSAFRRADFRFLWCCFLLLL